jgi:amidase
MPATTTMIRQSLVGPVVALAGLTLCSCRVVETAPPVFRLEEATIAHIHAALGAGALSCQQLVQLYHDRIAAIDDGGPQLNASSRGLGR